LEAGVRFAERTMPGECPLSKSGLLVATAGAHLTGDPHAKLAEKVIRADGPPSLGEDVFIVRHGRS
jgi:hypothetical protein